MSGKRYLTLSSVISCILTANSLSPESGCGGTAKIPHKIPYSIVLTVDVFQRFPNGILCELINARRILLNFADL